MIRIRWIFCCLIVIAAATSAHAAGYFVDAGAGDDANAGISAASPFATIQQAIDAAFENPGPDMIHIASGEYVENLTIDDDEKLTLAGSNGAVVTAADAEDDVITVKAGDVTISDLKITKGDNGIKTKGSETSLTLRDVDVSENANRGLSAKKVGSVTISGGSFSDNGGDGIKVGDEDNETYVKSVTVTGGTFSNNEADGLDLEKITTVTLRDVDVSGNEDRGLSAKKVGSVTISGGSFSDNGGDGIKVGDEDNEFYVKSFTITGGTFFNNDSDGLDLEKIAIVIVTNTTVDASGDEGLEVDVCDSVTVIGGAYTNNADDGLDIDNSQSVRVVGVLSTGNGEGNGLQIEVEEGFEMEEAVVVNCTFLGNGQNGAQIVEDGGVIHAVKLINITARDNVESGLEIVVSGKAKVTNITSQDNGADDILP